MEPWEKPGEEEPWEEPAPKRNPRIWRLLAAATVVSLLISALGIAFVLSGNWSRDELYDDPEALAGSNNYYSKMSVNHHRGDSWWGSVGELSGVWGLFSCTAEGDTWGEMDYTLEVTRGKAKLILVDPEGNVTTIRECLAGESAQEKVRLALPEGVSDVKLVGAQEAALSWRVEMD